jgi:hypothetical protein
MLVPVPDAGVIPVDEAPLQPATKAAAASTLIAYAADLEMLIRKCSFIFHESA